MVEEENGELEGGNRAAEEDLCRLMGLDEGSDLVQSEHDHVSAGTVSDREEGVDIQTQCHCQGKDDQIVVPS